MPPFSGGGIAFLSASFMLGVFLILYRLAISTLAPVVSLGSPGSLRSTLGSLTPPSAEDSCVLIAVRVRGRLLGGFEASIEVEDFLCFPPVLVAVVVLSSASSPDASRDEGCSNSAVVEFLTDFSVDEARFRLPELEDDGDDIEAA